MVVTSDEMMERAVTLFTEIGYEKVSIGMICKEFHVTRGSFYHHFKSKEDLLLQWFLKKYIQIEDYFVLDTTRNAYENFKRKQMNWASFLSKLTPDILFHSLNAFISYQENKKNFHEIDFSKIIIREDQLIAQAQENGIIRSTLSANLLIEMYSDLIIGICIEWKLCNGAFDICKKIETAFDLIYHTDS